MKKSRLVKNQIIKNQAIKNILSAVAVAIFGFILLNITFLFDALYQGIIRGIVNLFIPLTPDTNLYWFPPLMHGSFVIVIGIISWFVFKSKMKVLYKAIYMTVPLAVVYVTIGIFFYQWQIIVYFLSILFGAAVLYYLYHTKQPWIYYYTLILISFLMLLVALLGIEI